LIKIEPAITPLTQVPANHKQNKMHEGKHYNLIPEKSIQYIECIFGYTQFQRPARVSIKVSTQYPPNSIYFIADIKSDLGDLYNRVVSFEKTEKGTQVFVKMQGSKVSAPIGFLLGEHE